MFGGPSASGFAQLALLDGNHDGKVDATDNGLVDFNGDGVVDSRDTFDTLKVWVDANGNGVTDPGELHALSDFNIVSISVASTPSTATNGNNAITDTATFQRADGTTGTVADVQLRADDFNTKWTGDSSVSAEAAKRPDLKGYGTLILAKRCPIPASPRGRSCFIRRGFRSKEAKCRSRTRWSISRRAWPSPSRSRPVRVA
jgi:hypothetical protein